MARRYWTLKDFRIDNLGTKTKRYYRIVRLDDDAVVAEGVFDGKRREAARFLGNVVRELNGQ